MYLTLQRFTIQLLKFNDRFRRKCSDAEYQKINECLQSNIFKHISSLERRFNYYNYEQIRPNLPVIFFVFLDGSIEVRRLQPAHTATYAGILTQTMGHPPLAMALEMNKQHLLLRM